MVDLSVSSHNNLKYHCKLLQVIVFTKNVYVIKFFLNDSVQISCGPGGERSFIDFKCAFSYIRCSD